MEDDKFICMADCYYDAYGIPMSESKYKEIKSELPDDVANLADKWGWHDTEVRDKACVWMMKTMRRFKEGASLDG